MMSIISCGRGAAAGNLRARDRRAGCKLSLPQSLSMMLPNHRFLKYGFSLFPASVRLQLLRVIQKSWYDRIQLTLACPDNALIERAPNAGRVENGLLTMHNGLRIVRGSYNGETMSLLMELNRGVHEPQEELVFREVLKFISPGGSILELGAYWGFYSMWFATMVPSADCILVEPGSGNMEFGKSNFKLNGLTARFLQAYAGSAPPGDSTPAYTVDQLMEKYELQTLSMLHADIQGAERAMLDGAEKSFARNAIDYAFISTHSDQLHEQCIDCLAGHGFAMIAEASPSRSFSEDGVICARRSGIAAPPPIAISKRR